MEEVEAALRKREEEVRSERERIQTLSESMDIRERLVADKERHVGDSAEAAWSRLKEEAESTNEERTTLRAMQTKLFEQEREMKERRLSHLTAKKRKRDKGDGEKISK